MRTRIELIQHLMLCGLLAVVLGCGGGDDDGTQSGSGSGSGDVGSVEDDGEEVAADATAWDPAAGTATISGKVSYVGTAPKRRPVDMGAKAECIALHGDTKVLDDSVVVAEDGSVQSAFVWVKRGLSKWKFDPPSTKAALRQKGCMFEPHVLGMQVGQVLTITNADPLMHNIKATTIKNQAFNFSQNKQGAVDEKTFDRQEVMISVKCDVHSWMGNYVGVVEHPFFFVTGPDGAYELKGLPPGEYTIEVWHETFGKKSEKVTVADNEAKEVAFSYEG